MEENESSMILGTSLVLGKMPQGADPATVIASGPWCFAGQEDFFPEWDKNFSFAPEPLQNGADLENAAKACLGLCVDNIETIAGEICPWADDLPELYWQILLSPWLVDICRQIVERNLRVQSMIQAYGNLDMSVAVLPFDCSFNFVDEHDFTLRGSLGAEFNHWLFSRLLEPVWPKAWKKVVLEPIRKLPESIKQENRPVLRELARRFLLNLPFPRLKGMTLLQSLNFSMAINHPCHGPDHSLDLSVFSSKTTGINANLALDPLPILMAALPQSLVKLQHPKGLEKTVSPHVRVAGIVAYEDAAYRQKLAIWRARGNRLAYIQHGGNYGQIEVSCDRELVEYSQDAFFTWGWTRQGQTKGNFIPMPYPQLQRIADKWHYSGKETLIYVGTEMPAYGYRLESRPTPMQTVAYRNDKSIFFENLGDDLQEKSFYRPYFDVPGTLEDAAWLLPRFPHIRLCEGNLLPQILGCKLLVLDHHGTTMLEALAANVPVILFWRRESWPLCPEGQELLEILAKAGIWHDGPEEAAKKVRSIWNDVMAWWMNGKVQLARRKYCQNQAMTVAANENSLWIRAIKKL